MPGSHLFDRVHLMGTPLRAIRRGTRLAAKHPFGLLVCLAILLGGILNAGLREEERIGVPVPLLVYEIEAVSGNHRATLLNLGITPVGVVPLPMPVDVNGDLLPDVTVALGLVNVDGLFDYPPDVDNIIAPNLEINRLLPGVPLTHAAPPLRINAKITVLDVGGTSAPLHLRLGYDTGTGGSIPPKFKLVADGLTSFFNPVRARVEAPGYEGPLSVIAGIEQGGTRADADLRFLPLPTGLQFAYGSDDAGQHIGVSHAGAVGSLAADKEVDLQAAVKIASGADRSTIDARIDRLPPDVDVTVVPGAEEGGGFEYDAASSGGLPRPTCGSTSPHGPRPVSRSWPDSTSRRSPPSSTLRGPCRTTAPPRCTSPLRRTRSAPCRPGWPTSRAAPPSCPRYLPSAPQHLDLRQSADGSERLVTGRVEDVRLVDFVENERGLDAHVQAGGGAAIEVNASLGAVGEDRRQVDARSTVDPLPTDLTAIVRDAGVDQAAEPLEVTYRSSSEVDVTGHVEVRAEDLARSAPCGRPGTICADLTLTDLPSTIETKVAQVEGEDETDALVTVHSELRTGSPTPNITAGLVSADEEGAVLAADLGVTALPGDMAVRLVRLDGSLQRAEFHACQVAFEDPEGGCVAGTEGSIGALAVDVRSYLDGERPDGLAPVVLDRPEHVVVAGAGDADGMAFQAAGQFTDIEEVRYLASPTTGLRVRAGAGKELLAEVHLADIDPDPADDDEDSGQVFDLDATLGVPVLPPELDICIRPEGSAAGEGDELTAQCDDATPFGDDVELEEGGSPLSFGYVAAAPFDVDGSVHRREQGRTSLEEADVVLDDTVVDAGLDVIGLPQNLVLHLLQPTTLDPDDEDAVAGPLRARFEASTSPTRIEFSGGQRKGGAICKDRRPGAEATCLSGTLEHLPTLLDLYVDPAAKPPGPATIGGESNNIVLHTEGGATAKLSALDLSMVSPVKDADPPASDALLLGGTFEGIPADVAGKLRKPKATIPGDEPDLEIVAEPSLGTLDLDLRTSLDPDTFDPVPPAHLPQPAPFGQEIAVQAEGEDVKAHVHTTDLTRVAYRSVRDAEDRPLPTKVIALEFDGAQTARLYADLRKLEGGAVDRLTADIVAPHLPSGLAVCFRGAQPASTPEPAELDGTWCDTVADDQGAVEVVGTDGTDPTTSVDAYVRSETNGGTELVAARLGATNVPPILRATLPGRDDSGLDIVGFDTDGTTSRGIGELQVEAALGGDLARGGWTAAESPFRDRPLPTSVNGYNTPFPVPAPPGQHMSVGLDGDRLHLSARLGPGSQLQQLRMTNAPCAAPSNQPPDYPHYPLDDDTIDYRCIGGRFSPSAAGDALALSVARGTGPEDILRLHHAGLTDIPSWFQMTLADAPPTKGTDDLLRQRCGLASAGTQPEDCLPPLIRFDQPSAASELFGVLEQGDPFVAFTSSFYVPSCKPSGSTCAPDFDVAPPAGERGIRVKVLDVKPNAQLPSASLLKAGFRLAVPQSLTVASPQTWAWESEADETARSESAKDIRFAYAVRNAAGVPVNDLGRFAAFVHDHGQDILVTDIESAQGILLPGELDLGLYLRDTEVQGRKFLQIDGRSSKTLNAQLALFDGNLRPSDLEETLYSDVAGLERTTLKLRDVPAAAAGDPPDRPSFRIRFEMIKPPGDPGTPTVEGPPSALQLLGDLIADLDFDPDGSPARRIEAVMSLNGPLVGLEIVAFEDVDSPPAHQENAPNTTRKPAQFGLTADLVFEKLNYQLDDFDEDTYIHIESALSLHLDAQQAERFILRNNVASFNATVAGANSTAHIGPIIWDIDSFNVEVDTGAWIQAEITYDEGGDDTPVRARFSHCHSGRFAWQAPQRLTEPVPVHELHQKTFNGSVDLLDDPRFDSNIVNVPGDFIVEAVVGVFTETDPQVHARQATCNMQAGTYELIHHAEPFQPVLHPGDPLGVPGHDVPPANLPHLNVPPAGAERVGIETDTSADPVDVDIEGGVELCGVHAFDDLRIFPGAHLKVAVTANADPVPFGNGTDQRCPGGAEGSLHIIAKTVTVEGIIDANALMTAPPAPTTFFFEGHGGGGHGGRGGRAGCDDDGCLGLGQPRFSHYPPESPLTEPGMPGGNGFGDPLPIGGRGGGHIAIAATTITNDGLIIANGEEGQDACPTSDPNVGGGGGGSGGGISLVARTITNNAFIEARGGNGGEGGYGGGGGGGGIVKVRTPELIGAQPNVNGGLKGGACASTLDSSPGDDTDPTPHVKAVSAGQITSVADDATPSPSGWIGQRDKARFGYSVKLPIEPLNDENIKTVAFLCLVPRDEVSLDFVMPGPGAEDEEACGNHLARGGVLLTSREQAASAVDGIVLGVAPANIVVTDDSIPEGIWGAWIHTCFVPMFNGSPIGFICDPIDPSRANPDYVFGVDSTNPELVLDAPGLPTREVFANQTWFYARGNPNRRLRFPGFPGFPRPTTVKTTSSLVPAMSSTDVPVDHTLCHVAPRGENPPDHDGLWASCNIGTSYRSLRVGLNWVSTRVYLAHGSRVQRTFPILVDSGIPKARAVVTEGTPTGQGGWLRANPAISIEIREDMSVIHSDTEESGFAGERGNTDAFPVVAYTIDGGAERTLGFTSCRVTQSPSDYRYTCAIPQAELDDLGPGAHRIRYTAIDLVGNRRNTLTPKQASLTPELDMYTASFQIDPELPAAELSTVPATADGLAGWFTSEPTLVLRDKDRIGGSGIDVHQLTIDGTTEDYTGPVRLQGEGGFDHCAKVVDVAGNEVLIGCSTTNVDRTDPTITVASPAAPVTGWHRAPVLVTIQAADSTSGVPGFVAGGTAADCRLTPPVPVPAGRCVSIDGGPFEPSDGSHVVDEGEHVVRAFATDRAGRRSPVVERTIRVDATAPTTAARLVPPDPSACPVVAAGAVARPAGDGRHGRGRRHRVPHRRWCLDGLRRAREPADRRPHRPIAGCRSGGQRRPGGGDDVRRRQRCPDPERAAGQPAPLGEGAGAQRVAPLDGRRQPDRARPRDGDRVRPVRQAHPTPRRRHRAGHGRRGSRLRRHALEREERVRPGRLRPVHLPRSGDRRRRQPGPELRITPDPGGSLDADASGPLAV